uniref:Modification methylase n=1 Tax=Candidatus Endomicrobium sp. MdDo-005 TaxID=1837115 RepID=A0A1C9ZYF5_9BACT|nr:modification methylase [Candidatus Endomicrobium sp. MdDo-005]
MRNYIDLTDIVYIATAQDEEIKRSRLKEKDVLLTITGSYGKSAVVPRSLIDANINQHSVKITLKENINPYFLSTFLNSKYGKFQSDKNIVGITRPALDYEAIKNFIIPNAPKKFQSHIETIILESEKTNIQSQQLYRQAEELLLENIGLKNFKPSQENKNIKTLKESFLKTARLDAEYYQPKYEEIITKVKEKKFELLGNLVKIEKSIEPGSDAYSEDGVPFVRVSDYNKFGILKPEKCLSQIFCKENKSLIEKLYPKKETILFSKDGSVGIAYMLLNDIEAVTSGAILHLIVKNKKVILPEYLTLVLNSQIIQQQAERDAGGSVIAHWLVNEIQKAVIPLIDHKIQTEIADLVNKSFALRQESEKLLEQAEKSVEEKIENSKQF